MATKKMNLSMVPRVVRGETLAEDRKFPVDHYSYSSIKLFTTNPIMFKIKYVNRDRIDSTSNISGIIGQAFHLGMQAYWAPGDGVEPRDEAKAMEEGLRVAMAFLEAYNEGFIAWSDRIPNKQKAYEIESFAYTSYIKEKPYTPAEQIIEVEQKIKETITVEWRGRTITLPVPLKAFVDKISRIDGKLKIIDYKTCSAFSDPEKIDGGKIIQAVIDYLLVYAFYGEEPYSIIFEEVKTSKNRDGGKQTREYEIVYSKNELFFDFFFRLYDDVTRALSGEQVFVPNVDAFYDNEVAMIAYIHRLDMSEEQAALMKKHHVDNLTDLLKAKIQTAGNMRTLLKTVEAQFVSARNLNYDAMQNEQKIATKLMEHGMMLEFHSKMDGAAVELYRYTPSIGLKMAKLKGFVEDVEQVLGVSGIRILAPIPNSTLIGFEVPKEQRYFPALPAHDQSFDIAIGQTIMGEAKRFDIREAPHLLVAGATGSGKSVFLNSLIEQLATIPNVDLHLFDPKMVELSRYEDIAAQYLSDHAEINNALEDLVIEMEERYQKLQKARARNIDQMAGMHYKFVVIDEFGDLTANNDRVQRNVLLLAQKARAAGIHLIVATQRPSVDVISGTIKANFPTKVVFRVAKEADSRVVLDEAGAERLSGKGDMLFASDRGVERLQGFNV